jgi:hypothetical protein
VNDSILIQVTEDDLREIVQHINEDPDSGGPIDAAGLIAFVRDNNIHLHDEFQALVLNAFIDNEKN